MEKSLLVLFFFSCISSGMEITKIKQPPLVTTKKLNDYLSSIKMSPRPIYQKFDNSNKCTISLSKNFNLFNAQFSEYYFMTIEGLWKYKNSSSLEFFVPLEHESNTDGPQIPTSVNHFISIKLANISIIDWMQSYLEYIGYNMVTDETNEPKEIIKKTEFLLSMAKLHIKQLQTNGENQWIIKWNRKKEKYNFSPEEIKKLKNLEEKITEFEKSLSNKY